MIDQVVKLAIMTNEIKNHHQSATLLLIFICTNRFSAGERIIKESSAHNTKLKSIKKYRLYNPRLFLVIWFVMSLAIMTKVIKK